jgi:hypothetical protein
MKKYLVLKLVGLSLLVMITLIIISILEVTVYSYLVNPGQDVGVYDAHAEQSAPYISGIFGFLLFFLISRYWRKKGYENASRLMLLFPLTYVLLDLVIIVAAVQAQWMDFVLIFILANGAKFLGSYLGYKLTRPGQPVHLAGEVTKS